MNSKSLNYAVINDLLFGIDTQEKLANITPYSSLGIPENLKPVILQTYHSLFLVLHQEIWKFFFSPYVKKKYYIHNTLAKICIFVKSL